MLISSVKRDGADRRLSCIFALLGCAFYWGYCFCFYLSGLYALTLYLSWLRTFEIILLLSLSYFFLEFSLEFRKCSFLTSS